MSLRVLVDMNLSPEWVPFFTANGRDAVHWLTLGAADAPDEDLMAWARANGCVVFTHDLDFGSALALTHASGPSVIQLRGPRVLPEQVGRLLLDTLTAHEQALADGALIVLDLKKSRVRVLPL
jgi:predicted nuclease of predicted toxin-antitoxin system